MHKSIALGMSFLVGFLSLSQEILWVRVLGFLSQGAPYVLSIVLSAFLLGIALGAILGKKACSSKNFSYIWILYIWLVIGISDIFLPELLPFIMAADFNVLALTLLILFTAALKASVFPIVHHLFTSSSELYLGRSLSYVYLFNILGSTLGPLLTGFILLDLMPLFDVFRLMGVIGLIVPLCLMIIWFKKNINLALPVLIIYMGIICWGLFGKLASFSSYLRVNALAPLVFISENRQGVIHIIKDDVKGDIVYGGNAYDGRTNISLLKNTNLIDRVFLLSGLHPAPKKVLVMGLSAGAWTKVLLGNKAIEKIDVVEINPGYLNYIKTDETLGSILSDQRISIHVNDGRRWLRNLKNKNYYDLIVINTTFHWRAHSTNLLSKEMMELVQNSLAPKGIYAFNATGSKDAHFTASSVFKYAYRWSNFVYASNVDFIKDPNEISQKIMEVYESWPYDDLTLKQVSNIFSSRQFISIEQELAASERKLEIITDDNMIVEYKYGLK